MFRLTPRSEFISSLKNRIGLSSGDDPQKRKRRFIMFSLLLVALPPSILIGAAASLGPKTSIGRTPEVGYTPPDPDVEVYAEAVTIDPIGRTMVMDWYPRMPAYKLNCSEYLSRPKIREFYMPGTLMDASSPGWTDSDSYVRLYTLNSTAQCLDANTAAFSSFRTVTKLLSARDGAFSRSSRGVSSLQKYPFDKYWAPFALSLVDPDTGRSSAVSISHFVGIVVNFEIYLDNSNVKPSRNGDSELVFNFIIKRSKAVQGYVVGAAITTWLATIAFMIIVAATLVYLPHQIYAEMFVVPVGALFAFSSIRANLPGAPDGFGTTVDMYSILPVLIIMSCCSFSLLLIVLYRRISQVVDIKELMALDVGRSQSAPHRLPTQDTDTLAEIPREGTGFSHGPSRNPSARSSTVDIELGNMPVSGRRESMEV